MIRLLLDQGLPRRTSADLSDSDWDVVHVGQLNMAAATDEAILSIARDQDRTVVTLDSDFAKILASQKATKPSILHLRVDRLDRAAATRLLRVVVKKVGGELQDGVIASVSEGRIRIRQLPLP